MVNWCICKVGPGLGGSAKRQSGLRAARDGAHGWLKREGDLVKIAVNFLLEWFHFLATLAFHSASGWNSNSSSKQWFDPKQQM